MKKKNHYLYYLKHSATDANKEYSFGVYFRRVFSETFLPPTFSELLLLRFSYLSSLIILNHCLTFHNENGLNRSVEQCLRTLLEVQQPQRLYYREPENFKKFIAKKLVKTNTFKLNFTKNNSLYLSKNSKFYFDKYLKKLIL